jgi:sigma-B regulation protein RsbU (phosphoserine phosphatase)
MLIALWDDSTRTLCLANAGSVQPLLVRRRDAKVEVSTIAIEGFPLGLFPHASYDETPMPLASGDMVVFFSDGITDATNPQGESFGGERLRALLEQHPTATDSAQAAVDAILAAVKAHQDGAEHFDDETVVVLRAR